MNQQPAEYKNVGQGNLIELERVGSSGAIRKFKIIPQEGNRFAIVLYQDPTGNQMLWAEDKWCIAQCKSDKEFIGRFGKEMFDIVEAECNKHLRKVLSEVVLSLPEALSSLGKDAETELDLVKLKAAYLAQVDKFNNLTDNRLFNLSDSEFWKSRNWINKDFFDHVVVNAEYMTRIVLEILPLYEVNKRFNWMGLEFSVLINNGKQKKSHKGNHKVDSVKLLIDALQNYIDFAYQYKVSPTANNIIGLTAAYAMAHKSFVTFKLFEQE